MPAYAIYRCLINAKYSNDILTYTDAHTPRLFYVYMIHSYKTNIWIILPFVMNVCVFCAILQTTSLYSCFFSLSLPHSLDSIRFPAKQHDTIQNIIFRYICLELIGAAVTTKDESFVTVSQLYECPYARKSNLLSSCPLVCFVLFLFLFTFVLSFFLTFHMTFL